MKYTYRHHRYESFQCSHCHSHVSTSPLVAGVQNRNHCPYCLWSRHVDLSQAGDRLAGCQGMMRPIGVTLKRTRKKYGMAQYGELMLIHRCEDCGRLSVNRIAADDDANLIYELYRVALQLDSQTRAELEASDINALSEEQEWIVRAQLFGKS